MTDPKEQPTTCQGCKARAGEPDRPCPYQQDINDNEDNFCNCCDECRRECIDEI